MTTNVLLSESTRPSTTPLEPTFKSETLPDPADPESPAKKKKKPYKELTLEEKVKLIKLAESNHFLSQASIAERYSIAKSNVCRILQRKEEYLNAFKSANFAGTRKRKLRNAGEKDEVREISTKDAAKNFGGLKSTSLYDIAEKLTVALPPLTTDDVSSMKAIKNSLLSTQKKLNDFGVFYPSHVSEQFMMALSSLTYTDNAVPFPQPPNAALSVDQIVNQALTKHVQELYDRLTIYEEQHGKVRTFLLNATTAGWASSPDAKKLMTSLMTLL